MNENESNEYYGEWDKVGAVYDQGDYFDLFRTADLLITDCWSFLTEWLPTEKPCIRLLTVNDAQKMHSPVHESSSRNYYKVKSLDELYSTLDMLAVRREDPLAESRIQDAKNIPLDSAKNIHQWLIETLGGSYDNTQERRA
jgi:CDP-glycerol glycerophosphotransferase (TagB/SpsB family)